MANEFITATTASGSKYRVYDPGQKESKQNDALDKDAFLKLLVTQLQNQDPLNPMEDREFISQMAQFSALEQMQQLNTNMQATQLSIIDHITAMNNNMVKSQTSINSSIDDMTKILKLMAKHQGVELPDDDETDTENKDKTESKVPEGE